MAAKDNIDDTAVDSAGNVEKGTVTPQVVDDEGEMLHFYSKAILLH